MTNDTNDELSTQVEELERRTARYRKVVIAVGVGILAAIVLLVVLFVQISDVSGRLQAFQKSFHESGLTVGAIRGKTIVLTNEKGQTMVKLTAVQSKTAGLIRTYNEKGEMLVELGVTEGNTGSVATFNRQGKELVSLGATEGNMGSVVTFNGKGKPLVSLGAAVEAGTAGVDAGAVVTFTGKGQPLVEMSASTAGGGSLLVRNRFGESVCTMDESDDGQGIVGAWNRAGKGRTLTPGPQAP